MDYIRKDGAVYAESLDDLEIGQTVITPLGKKAIVKKFMSNTYNCGVFKKDDPFDRVKLEYIDENNKKKKCVDLQPRLLIIN